MGNLLQRLYRQYFPSGALPPQRWLDLLGAIGMERLLDQAEAGDEDAFRLCSQYYHRHLSPQTPNQAKALQILQARFPAIRQRCP